MGMCSIRVASTYYGSVWSTKQRWYALALWSTFPHWFDDFWGGLKRQGAIPMTKSSVECFSASCSYFFTAASSGSSVAKQKKAAVTAAEIIPDQA